MQTMNMQQVMSPAAHLLQAHLEASRRVADAFFAGVKKVDNLMLEASHRACIEQLRLAQSLAAVRDAQGASHAQATYLAQRPDRAMDYQRDMIRVLTEVQADLGKSMRSYLEQIGNGAIAGFSGAVDPAAVASPDLYQPMASIMSAWQSVFRDAASMASQNFEMARGSFTSMAAAAGSAADAVIDETVEAMTAGKEGRTHASAGAHSGNHGRRR